jgi:hypothetical protein
MTTLREAAQQALEALEELNGWQSLAPPLASQAGRQAAISLRAALEQQKPPPEAQTEAEKIAYCAGWWAALEQKREQPEQPEQPEQAEPVAWECKAGGLKPLSQRLYDLQPDNIQRHYTRISRREWRSLSEEEISRAYFASASHTEYARAIEQACKERNP